MTMNQGYFKNKFIRNVNTLSQITSGRQEDRSWNCKMTLAEFVSPREILLKASIEIFTHVEKLLPKATV